MALSAHGRRHQADDRKEWRRTGPHRRPGRRPGDVNAGGVGPAFALICVDVEVDPDTGKVQVLRCTVAQDVGRAIHPSYVEGQMQGGTAQGIGWALNEEYVYDGKGNLRNTGLLDYRMPTCLDLPMIEPRSSKCPIRAIRSGTRRR